jgi:hypothetical protein
MTQKVLPSGSARTTFGALRVAPVHARGPERNQPLNFGVTVRGVEVEMVALVISRIGRNDGYGHLLPDPIARD